MLHESCWAGLKLVRDKDRTWRLYRSINEHSTVEKVSTKSRGIHRDIREKVKTLGMEGKGPKGIVTALRKESVNNPDVLSQIPSVGQVKYFKTTLTQKRDHAPIKYLGDVFNWGQDAQRYVITKEALYRISSPFKVLVLKVKLGDHLYTPNFRIK